MYVYVVVKFTFSDSVLACVYVNSTLINLNMCLNTLKRTG
jgi:hypothetical protein